MLNFAGLIGNSIQKSQITKTLQLCRSIFFWRRQATIELWKSTIFLCLTSLKKMKVPEVVSGACKEN